MKIKKLLTASGLAAVLAMTFCLGCSDNETQQTVPELQEGVITYENAVCESIIGVENSGTVATASASNGATISYSMTEDEAQKLSNAFDGALKVAADGTIEGKYDKTKKFKVGITASAEKCESVTAEITVSVVNPYLDYAGSIIAEDRVNFPYASSV